MRSSREGYVEHKSWAPMRAILQGIVPRESNLAGLALARIMELARALTSLSPTPGVPPFLISAL